MPYLTAALVFLSFPATSGEIRALELSLAGIAVGEAETRVIERLGAPRERIEPGEGKELRYPGLVVTVGWLEQAAPGSTRRVYALRASGQTACTPAGLCPGMEVAHATTLYGAVETVVRDSGTFPEYQPAESHCWLQVAARDEKITSLAVACQP